jgi:hypothetical protein
LANGNTLITESTRGRAFEITPEGEMVWEYLNRDISADGTARRTIWRMARLTEKQIAALNWPDEARTRLIEAGFDLSLPKTPSEDFSSTEIQKPGLPE